MSGSNADKLNRWAGQRIAEGAELYIAWCAGEILAADSAAIVRFVDNNTPGGVLYVMPRNLPLRDHGLLAWSSAKEPPVWRMFDNQRKEGYAPLGAIGLVPAFTGAYYKRHVAEHFDAVAFTPLYPEVREDAPYILIAKRYLSLLPYSLSHYRVDTVPGGTMLRFWRDGILHMVVAPLAHVGGDVWVTHKEIVAGKLTGGLEPVGGDAA